VGRHQGQRDQPLATTRLGGDLDPIFGAGRTGPSQVAAVAAFLASPACQLNGEHLHAGAGHVARVFSGLARGWAKASEDLSAEEVLNHLESILDNSTHTEPDSVRDVLTSMASIVLGDPGEADERVARWLRQQATDLAQAASGSQTH
jgi:uncharacterized Zn finger protein